jgi:hypothetical protein
LSDSSKNPRTQSAQFALHPKYKTKYRVHNWRAYDPALVLRGDITIWLSPEAIGAWVSLWPEAKPGAVSFDTQSATEW